ncbi:uncharacterized protein SKDI_13G0070 [Saccharomyces kudriavzevii IFO 1802]|uniref:Uncharacterized protein n=2 Tax=Saccharomyces kudriavzevii (strain ATCC MYA-4449 / AS 2.2408 / CBS 8840 / NBRC 1802 / NCYC 2889) TaxID=226230 RepID=A0AA35NL34_SACK1|nr:uncharacterized protein SKDI_13G0070 [Saccharomyces kudriavzevii IFO 1802]EJT44314.1 hypothetical protein SKUD_199504 [Saccharomyces kudriavzevii IFO 1802]CAI4047468.1 hypothetical protein SKDI_13G0070 [Saccharomyces kudriavzevii IFO 1802]
MIAEPLMTTPKLGAEALGELSQTENIILPKDVNPDHFLYSSKKHILVFFFLLIHIMVVIILGCLICTHHANTFIVILMIISFFTLPLSLVVLTYFLGEDYILDLLDDDGKMNLLVEVIHHKPNADKRTWDLIAHNMNQFAYDHGKYCDKSLFYDGDCCYRVFRSLAIVPYGNNLDRNNEIVDHEVRSTHGTANTNERCPEMNFELRTYILKALAVYRESVDSYWANKYPELAV